MENEDIGQRIMMLRKKCNYTREQLAAMSNISSKFLYEVENGKKRFSADVLCRLAKCLDVSCDYIMFGENALYSEEYQLEVLLHQIDVKDIKVILKILLIMCDLKMD